VLILCICGRVAQVEDAVNGITVHYAPGKLLRSSASTCCLEVDFWWTDHFRGRPMYRPRNSSALEIPDD